MVLVAMDTVAAFTALDVAILTAVVVVGVVSALLTGWTQNHQRKVQRAQHEEDRRREERGKRQKSLVNYERALWEKVISIEDRETGTSRMSQPDNLHELRAVGYRYFAHLRDADKEEDALIYWRLFDPIHAPANMKAL